MGTRQFFVFDLELAVDQRRTELAYGVLLLNVTLEDPLTLELGTVKWIAREALHAPRDFHFKLLI